LHDKSRALNAGFFPLHQIDHLNRVIMLLCPARVHPIKHLRPIASLGPARAGVDAHDRIIGIKGSR